MRQRLRFVDTSYNFDVQGIMASHRGGGHERPEQNEHTTSADQAQRLHRVPARGQFASDLTLATKGNSLRKKFMPFGTDARVRRVHGNA